MTAVDTLEALDVDLDKPIPCTEHDCPRQAVWRQTWSCCSRQGLQCHPCRDADRLFLASLDPGDLLVCRICHGCSPTIRWWQL